MKPRGRFYTKDGKKIYVVREICDYFGAKTFLRLKEDWGYAQEANADLYIAVCAEDLLEKYGRQTRFKEELSDDDRVFMLEALDFVKGAFPIHELGKEAEKKALAKKIADQQKEAEEPAKPVKPKEFKVGYASGGFSNLHKGHIEHMRDMAEMCDFVVVGANSDRLIREYKHKKTTVDERIRQEVISHIKYVNKAVIVDDYDKKVAINRLKEEDGISVDAVFAGSDWRGHENWKRFEEELGKVGIAVRFTERPENGMSTTKIDKLNGSDTSIKDEEVQVTQKTDVVSIRDIAEADKDSKVTSTELIAARAQLVVLLHKINSLERNEGK